MEFNPINGITSNISTTPSAIITTKNTEVLIKTFKKSPNFMLKTIKGDSFELYNQLNKGPVLLSFWATWCAPCLKELFEFKKIETKYKKYGLSIVAISIDKPSEKGKVNRFVRLNRYPFIMIHDASNSLKKIYKYHNIPYNILINKNGDIVYSHQGYNKGDELEIEEKIKQVLFDQNIKDRKRVNKNEK